MISPASSRPWPRRRLAWLVFIGIALVLTALSPLDLRGMGYSDVEIAASVRLLSWVSGEAQPASAPPWLSPKGIVTHHGLIEPIVKLPFVATGRALAPLFPDSPRFAERFVAILPVLQTALMGLLLFLWAERLTANPRWGVALAFGGVFCTLLWPYAYIGLEPTQALALLFAGYLALAPRAPGEAGSGKETRFQTVAFVAVATVAVASRITGLLLLPAVSYLVYRHFRGRSAARAPWRPLAASLATILFILAVVRGNQILRSYAVSSDSYSAFLRDFLTFDPVLLGSSALMLLFSGNKGLVVYAPLAILGLACAPAAWRKQRGIAIFALLVFASLVGGFSVLGVPAEETWGPRYIFAAVPILCLCVAAAWGREPLRVPRRLVLSAALLAGLAISALGSLFYYGRPYQMATSVDQGTLEALWGDPVWNPVAMNIRLARLWLSPPEVSTQWTPRHRWWFTRPAGVPPDPTIDIGFASEPQPALLRPRTRSRPALFTTLAASLACGVGALALAWRGAGSSGGSQVRSSGPLLSAVARRRKAAHFLAGIPKDAAILEIGSGSGWVGEYLRANGWTNYVGLDIVGPANVVGDILKWRNLGLEPESFDVIVAFELVEHVDCFRECHELLRPGGQLLLTSPVPHMDWAMRLLEALRLNQRRTSPHDHLVYFDQVPWSGRREIRTVGLLSQWGAFTKDG